MKTSIKTFALTFAIIASAAFTASAGEKETKKPTSFGAGIYTTKGGNINVLVDKANENTNTILLLKNENGEVVYKETISKHELKFGRSLNVNSLETGNYKLDIISGKEVQSKSFQLSEQKTERTLTVQ